MNPKRILTGISRHTYKIRIINHKKRIIRDCWLNHERMAEFDIMFGKGISRSGEILDLAVDHDIINKSGSWFAYNDTKLGQGRDAVKTMLEDNPELSEEVEAKICEQLA